MRTVRITSACGRRLTKSNAHAYPADGPFRFPSARRAEQSKKLRATTSLQCPVAASHLRSRNQPRWLRRRCAPSTSLIMAQAAFSADTMILSTMARTGAATRVWQARRTRLETANIVSVIRSTKRIEAWMRVRRKGTLRNGSYAAHWDFREVALSIFIIISISRNRRIADAQPAPLREQGDKTGCIRTHPTGSQDFPDVNLQVNSARSAGEWIAVRRLMSCRQFHMGVR
jgi:hypothetical protein